MNANNVQISHSGLIRSLHVSCKRLEWVVFWRDFLFKIIANDRHPLHDVDAHAGDVGKEEDCAYAEYTKKKTSSSTARV